MGDLKSLAEQREVASNELNKVQGILKTEAILQVQIKQQKEDLPGNEAKAVAEAQVAAEQKVKNDETEVSSRSSASIQNDQKNEQKKDQKLKDTLMKLEAKAEVQSQTAAKDVAKETGTQAVNELKSEAITRD